jgi:hypothetical protein
MNFSLWLHDYYDESWQTQNFRATNLDALNTALTSLTKFWIKHILYLHLLWEGRKRGKSNTQDSNFYAHYNISLWSTRITFSAEYSVAEQLSCTWYSFSDAPFRTYKTWQKVQNISGSHTDNLQAPFFFTWNKNRTKTAWRTENNYF